MTSMRKTFIVRGACPRHGEDAARTLDKYTFTKARLHTWDCPHEEEGNQAVQVIEIVDAASGKVEWARPSKKCKTGGIAHTDYDFD